MGASVTDVVFSHWASEENGGFIAEATRKIKEDMARGRDEDEAWEDVSFCSRFWLHLRRRDIRSEKAFPDYACFHQKYAAVDHEFSTY